jgi:hypothetical protein
MMAIKRLEALGFNLHSEGEEIVCRSSGGRKFDTPEVHVLLAELKENKAEALRYLRSQVSHHAIRAFSKVLNKEITISWTGENPKVIRIDRTPYSLKEIEKLKALAPSVKDLSAIHHFKTCFDGQLLNDDPGIHGN